MVSNKICVVGTVGLPARYGGFETLVENLADYHSTSSATSELIVYCSGPSYDNRVNTYRNTKLLYVELKANGVQSILYDIVSIMKSVKAGASVILVLGVSGAIALPFVRAFCSARIVTNIDGLEWKREKWGRFARWFLKWSEKIAVRQSHVVIGDNQAICDYIRAEYGESCLLYTSPSPRDS